MKPSHSTAGYSPNRTPETRSVTQKYNAKSEANLFSKDCCTICGRCARVLTDSGRI